MTEASERELHLLDYWRILVKRRWVIYTSLAVVVSVTMLGSLLTRPVYTATTRLQIEQSAPKVLPFQDVTASLPDFRNDFYQTQYGLIQSRRVAREVIATLRLADLPEPSQPDLVVVATRVPQAVVCLISALSFHGITTQVPHEVQIALPRGRRTPRLDHPPTRVFRIGRPQRGQGSPSRPCASNSRCIRPRRPRPSR